MALTQDDIKKYSHSTEESRFFLSFVVIIPVVIIFIAITIKYFLFVVIYFLVIFGFLWIVTQTIIASYIGNLVRISDKNFPEISSMIEQKKTHFGYDRKIDAFIVDAEGYNAYIVPLLQRKVIILEASMLKNLSSRTEIEWVVGRFIGALAARHYRFMILEGVLNAIENLWIFNIFLFPYERSIQYSGDQLGLIAMNNNILVANNGIDVAARSICKLMSGPEVGDMVNYAGILDQRKLMQSGFFNWLARCFSLYPPAVKRLENLVIFSLINTPVKAQDFIAKNGLRI